MNDVRIIETMGWHPGEGVRRRNLHLARMGRTALHLGYKWDRRSADAALDSIEAGCAQRLRLTLGADGDVHLQRAELAPARPPWCLSISPTPLRADDPWLQIKTTQRALYDSTRGSMPNGVDEVIFINENNRLCEGTITNLFVAGNGRLLTPHVRAGLLPGILRQELLSSGDAEEADLTVDDLKGAGAIYVGNSLRGLIPAVLV